MTAVSVNGKLEQVATEPDTALLYVLRNHLGLKGTRFGCGLALCGSCMVLVDGRSVTSDTWETYPILTFSEVPTVDVELLPDNGNPSLGVGEAAQGPTGAAIVNAIYDAIGVRVRSMPFTTERIVAAMPD